MDRWLMLYDRFNQQEQQRQVAQLRAAQHAAQLEAFNNWSRRTTHAVMQEIKLTCARRSVEFEQHTSKRVLVQYPSHPLVELAVQGPEMTFQRFQLDTAQVHVYSFRGPGMLPFFYLLSTSTGPEGPPSVRHQTLISVPAAYAARLPNDGFELRKIPIGSSPGAHTPTDVDEIVFVAFEMLVNSLSRVAPLSRSCCEDRISLAP